MEICIFITFVAIGFLVETHTKLKSERNKNADLRKELETVKRENNLAIFDKNEIIAQQAERIEELEDAIVYLNVELKKQKILGRNPSKQP
ncbi:MAG: hypothetical protein HDQ89_10455 [Desulfovibrio sp.]|nr:hypothetical protein [Desulfovibrio sp.]